MINKIYLGHFQSHLNTEIDFDKGLNCIVGSSNSGKTAIIRAIRWVMENRPSGLSILNNKKISDTAQVMIQKDGHQIVKSRSKKDNVYDVDDLHFESVGKDVPEEVIKILNLKEINMQKQLDLPFLALESPGSIASVLNSYSKLDQAEQMVNSIVADQRANKNQIYALTDTLERINKSIESKLWLDDFESKVLKWKELQKKIEAETKIQEHVKDILGSILEIGCNQETLTVNVNNFTVELEFVDNFISKQDEIDSLNQKKKVVEDILASIEKEVEYQTSIINTIQTTKESLDDVLNKISDVGECPYCGSSLTNKTKKILLENV